MTSLQQNQNQEINIFAESNSYLEPNIRKAKFSIGSKRFYTLEFDQNIEMQELKVMIQKAAHLRKNTFRLFSEGIDYTDYSDEAFDSLFPDQALVLFTLELEKGENFEENELLLQINTPCPDHDYKFLLYYCFECGKSICSECFTNGPHKGHKIQDKCFYLLSSKYLVEKMFENWSKRPYEDYQISVDLNEYKNNINNVIFKQLFDMLKEAKKKCNDLIDKYNLINQKSLSNIRDSVRDIKVSCIKALDEYKDLINIKDIINNQEVFKDFDHAYKNMKNKQKEKFKENMQKFQELNKGVSILVENLVNDVTQMIKDVLVKALDGKQYEEVSQKINLKLINPVNKDDIWNQLSDKKIKIKRNKKFGRKTISNLTNENRLKKIVEGNEEIDYEKNNTQKIPQGRNTVALENTNSINYFNNTNTDNNNKSNDDYITGNDRQVSNGKINNTIFSRNAINDINNIKYSCDSTLQKPSFLNTNNEKNNKNISQILNNTNTNYTNNAINDFNTISENINDRKILLENQVGNTNTIPEEKSSQNNQIFEKSNNKFDLANNNQIGSEENNNTNAFNGKPSNNIFASILTDNKNNNNINNNNSNIFNIDSNKISNIFSDNIVSPICDNRTLVSNNGIFSNNSSFNCDLNNINIAQQKKDGIILNNDINNDKKLQNPFDFKNNNENNIDNNTKNIVLASPFSQINSNINENNVETSHFNNNSNSTNSFQNSNVNNNINTPSQNKNLIMNITDNKYLAGLANNCKTILEEANESESDLKTRKEFQNMSIEYYLKKPYILCPIPTTNKIKIITEVESDESFLAISFPSNLDISSFLYSCSHCNYKQKLYISGGVTNPGASEIISNKFYMIDLSKFKIEDNNNSKNNKDICFNSCIFELSPMIYGRYNHSMIAYNNQIYAVGGEGMNSVEKYDIENDEWTEISPMIKKRSNTNLAVANGYLYAFFGRGEDGKYPESIERINIEDDNPIWEMIIYRNPSNICTKVYGCGLYQIDELIYFLGGNCNEKKSDEIFYFNLNERRIDYTNSKLAWKESFRENTLFDVGNKIIQITDEKFYGVYLKISVE